MKRRTRAHSRRHGTGPKYAVQAPPRARYTLRTVDDTTERLSGSEIHELGEGVEYDRIAALRPGETYYGGGGASPEWWVRRDK